MVPKPLRQCYAIMVKNFSNHLTNKKKLLGQFIFPTIISALYMLMQKQKQQNPLIGIIFGVLLKMYIAMIGLSAVRELVTLFLNQRQQKHRQYQIIFGLSTRTHTLSNLFYMGLYVSLFLLPFYLTLNYYQFKLHYIGMFAAFVISSLTCSMMLTSFFTDHKVASQVIGMFFSLSSLLALLYSGGQKNEDGEIIYTAVDYLAMFIPNSSFSIAIIYDNTKASLLSIYIVKIYLLIYSIMEFPHQYKQLFTSCSNRVKKCMMGPQQNKNILTQQFNVSDQLQQNQSPNNSATISQDTMIKISSLVKTYKIKQGQFNALNKINLSIKKRQIFGLLGRNGAGKTTLVDILTDVSSPTGGYFKINFQNPQQQDLQRIGICYQHQILYEQLTVEQHLYFYSRIKNIKSDLKQTIDQIVNMLVIKDEFKKKIKQLSGGNKRKLSVAIALLGNPELMIFDEPTSGLDPLSRRSVWQILQKLRRNSNCSIILTTHHLDEAQVLSDLICVIQKGVILVQNTPDVIKSKYGNGYYLTLEFPSPLHLQKTLPHIVSHLEQSLEKVQNLGTQHNISRLFLKFPSPKSFQKDSKYRPTSYAQSQSEESILLSQLEWLSGIDDLKIQIQKNSLQQSFIAILKDPENGTGVNSSGDSIQLRNVTNRPMHARKTLEQQQNESVLSKVVLIIKQTLGIFIRCVYFHKGNSLKFFLTYNVNILIFLFAMMFNKFILKVIQEGTPQNNEYSDAIKKSTQNQQYSNNMLILQGYIIMAGAFISIPIYEKQKNIRRVFNSRGVSPIAYWLGNFIFDFGYYLINLLVLSKIISPQSFNFLFSGPNPTGLHPFVSLGVGVIIYTYTVSNIFQKITTANTWFSIINMLLGFIILPMVIIGKQTYLGYLSFIKYFYPFYDLNLIIMNQTMSSAGGEMMKKFVVGAQDHQSYIYYTILIYTLLLVLIQIRAWDKFKQYLWDKQKVQRNQNNIELRAVSKQYGTLQALRNVSYFVADQRLALLGHNGAGKSTTFGLLSGQINPTSGRLFLQNKTKLNHQKIMRSAGICYQQNCLWQNMTPLQIFNIFSYVVPIQNSGKQIEWLLQSLEFQSMNFNKRFENLSGGNKRKICMAVSLYGDPLIRLLDECSTGLDPSSRVAMVETIKQSRSGSTIFTTHSMSQAQNLCSKTVIMKKGQVMEFDYIYKLKQKYYNCYWIDIVFMNCDNLGFGNNQQNFIQGSYVQQNMKSIQQQLRAIVQDVIEKQDILKGVDAKKKGPKVLKATKESKLRVQFEKAIWPLHIALKIVYALRDKLQAIQKKQLIQSIYISQPKLQDIYIRLTHENTQEQDAYHYKEYTAQEEQLEQVYDGKQQLKRIRGKTYQQGSVKKKPQTLQKEIQLVQI